MSDAPLEVARCIVAETLPGSVVVRSFFDQATFTATHVVSDPVIKKAAIVDSLLDFDASSGRTATASADAVLAYVTAEALEIEWLLETHVHADHFSAAPYLKEKLGGRTAIGRDIVEVQRVLGEVFNWSEGEILNGSQFDHLFDDGEQFAVGSVQATVLHVPGHTPADVAYVIGDAAFVGDTLFMPDYGTARADFPGGDARMLYRSIRRLLALPEQTRLFLCHDYKAPSRDEFVWETTVAAERGGNVHVRDGVDEDAFVAMRETRDRALSMPRLILPSIQVNLQGGRLPEPESNGTRYLKLPVNRL